MVAVVDRQGPVIVAVRIFHSAEDAVQWHRKYNPAWQGQRDIVEAEDFRQMEVWNNG